MTGGGLPPGMTLPMRRKALVLAGILSTMFLAALDQTIVTVSMPAIAQDLDGLDLFVWPVTSYLLASSALVPVVGKLSDVYGRKPFILVGIVVFVVGSWLCGAAGDMTWLIAFRAIQGVGAGLIMTTAFTSVGDLFSPKDRGRWIGLFAATFGLASIVGPLVGGTLTDHLSWRWIFYVNIPVAMVALALVSFGMPWFRGQGNTVIDWLGALLIVGMATALLLGLSWGGNQYGWGEAPVVASLAAGAALLVLFLVQTRRAEDPILSLGLFRNRVYTVSILATMVLGAAMFGAMQFLPFFLQGVQGVTATNTGLILMPMMGGMMFGSVTSGQLLSRGRDLRLLTVVGGAALLTAFYLLSTLEQSSAAWTTRGYMVLLGLGMGFWMPTFQLAVQNALPHRLLGTGTASVNFFRQFGATFGLAILGSLMLSTFKSNLENAVPPRFGELLSEPERLLREDSLAALHARIEQASPGAADGVIQSAQLALGDAITGIFLIGVGIVAVGLAIGLFMPRVRMRGREELMAEASGESLPDEDDADEPGGFGVEPEEAGAPGGK
jgi:EmrB/QacA subfamily drug resistance transporter